jgi:DNA-binding transcriptional MerR regulator
MTIDDFAQRVRLPVRTLREYHTMRLLPPPERRGRVGLYGATHVHRVELIARLRQRGYSLAGIRDLLEAWDSGTDLTALLGVDRAPAAVDETPLRLSRAELVERLPGLDSVPLGRAARIGLVHPDDADHFLVRSPALLGLVADGVGVGLALDEMLDLIGTLTNGVDALAHVVAELIAEHIWQPLAITEHAEQLPGLLQRGRLLLLQGIVSTLADRLAAALLARADDLEDGDALRSAIDRIRVGVVVDAEGAIHRRGNP